MASSITQSGGYDYEFVDTNLPDEFQCLICRLVPRDVHQANCCGKMFCKSCLDEWKTKSNKYVCPNCREKLTNKCFKDSNMNRKIRHLYIYCTNKDKKCDWEGSLQDIDNHLSQIVECSNGCGQQLTQCNLNVHLTTQCPKRMFPCSYCQHRDEYQHIISIHLTQCPDYPLPCPNNGCEENIKRRLMTQHRDECPHEIVTCSNGCGFKRKRYQLPTHLLDCPKRIVSCPHCQHRGEHRSITGVHLTQCPGYPLPCPNNGCEENIKRRLMTQHRDECPHEMVMCSNGCGIGLKRHELHIHLLNKCQKRIVSCVYCHKEDEYQIINGGHCDICPDYPLLCPKHGCEEIIKRHLMTQHRAVCLHEMMTCSNGCGFELKRYQLPTHLLDCPKRIVSCPRCQHKGEHRSITGVHLTQCPDYPLPCPNNGCEENIKRRLMTQHRAVCLHEMMTCSNGCGFKLKRYQVPAHLLDCPKRIVSCPHCQHRGEHRSITGIHLTQCPDYPLPCPNNGCEENIKRLLMTQHRAVCLHEMMTCSNRCGFKLKRYQVPAHRTVCLQEMVMCSNGCGFELKRHELKIHQHKTCPKRMFPCSYCQHRDEYQHIISIHLKQCPNIPLHCPNNGCNKKIKRRLMTQHRDECPHEMMMCSNGCGFKCKRYQLPTHLLDCPKRIVSCPHCQHRSEHRSITGVHLTQCPDYPLPCPNNGCEENIKRCLMTQHRDECPHEMVMCSNGCGIGLKRHELHIHLLNKCQKRIVSCVYCHKEDEYQIINGDHNDVCPDYPLPCPNNGCEEKIKRCLVTQHRAVCLHEMMTCSNRCGFKLKRYQVPAHRTVCLQEMVMCSNGCGFELKRHELKIHQHKTCPKRIVSCPHCQHKGEHRSITGVHLTQCPDYPLPCPNNGCEKKIKRCLVTQHRAVCLHEMMTCSNGCGFKLKLYQLPTHLLDCPKRIVSCPHCQHRGEHRSITGVHLTQCPGYPLPCPNNGCEENIKRRLMTQHRDECPHEMVMCSNRCGFKLKRYQVPAHRTVCLQEMVMCSNGCGFELKRHELKIHQHKTCPKRIVSCPHCQHKGEHRSITGVHLTQCTDYPIPCPNNGCEKKIKRCLVTQHRTVCLHEMVMCSNGCGFKLKRYQLPTHLLDCPKRIVSCPHCQHRGEHRSITGIHLTQCTDYPIPCPNNGCEENIKRCLMTEHRTVCLHEMVMCSNRCGFELKRHELYEHLQKKCPKRIHRCYHCHQTDEYQIICSEDHYTECPGYPVPCPNNGCEEKIKRRLVTQHRRTCPKEEVECWCSYKYFGCQEKIKREDVIQHNIRNIIEHFLNIMIVFFLILLILVSIIFGILQMIHFILE